MKERPILFSGPMVRAILEGRKTQTRRVVKPQPYVVPYNDAYGNIEEALFWRHPEPEEDWPMRHHCPFGKPGDRLWVKETWQYYGWTEDGEPFIRYAADGKSKLKRVNSYEWGEKIWDIFSYLSAPENYNIDNHARDRRWRPSIHMPRWASRITLRITDIRVERLQDISDRGPSNDCTAEGVYHGGLKVPTYEEWHWRGFNSAEKCMFRDLWDSINGKRSGCSWDDNPWVWVVEFEKIG